MQVTENYSSNLLSTTEAFSSSPVPNFGYTHFKKNMSNLERVLRSINITRGLESVIRGKAESTKCIYFGKEMTRGDLKTQNTKCVVVKRIVIYDSWGQDKK